MSHHRKYHLLAFAVEPIANELTDMMCAMMDELGRHHPREPVVHKPPQKVCISVSASVYGSLHEDITLFSFELLLLLLSSSAGEGGRTAACDYKFPGRHS